MDGERRYAQHFCLPDVDETFLIGVADADHPLLRRVLTVPGETLEPGPWTPGAQDAAAPGAFAALILDGLLAEDVVMAGRASTVLRGPGDALSPWHEADSLIPYGRRWTALIPTRIAVLESRFLLAVRRWPQLVIGLHDRLAEHSRRAALDKAILQLPNAELRVLGVLWHLADRWGRMAPAGVVLPLQLTHGALGSLIGAERPTVTLALRALANSGLVERRSDGSWLLRKGSQAVFASDPGRVPEEAPQIGALEPLRLSRDAPAPAPVPAREAADAALDPATTMAVAATLRDGIAYRRARLDSLLAANREIVAAAMETRARIAERRRERADAMPPPRAP